MKRVGFSLVLCRYIDMDVEATIGHFNLIIVDSLVMKKESRIGHLNFIKGGFDVLMDEKSSIHNLNKISSIAVLYESVCLHLRRNARIGVSHLLDLTSSITIGENSMLAGADTQIWTHSFYFEETGMGYVRVDGEVHIGSNCYIGARCTILPNVFIGNVITVGAATCVSKSLKNKGAYVSPPVIHLDYSFDEAVLKLKGREMMSRIYKKQIT